MDTDLETMSREQLIEEARKLRDGIRKHRRTIMGNDSYTALPISIKGVLLVEGGVVLVRNPRNEWELPGGRIEPGETPQGALAREFEEELSLRISVGAQIDSYVFEVVPGKCVRIVTYGCTLAGAFSPRLSDEHTDFCLCAVRDLPAVNLPHGYRASAERWSNAA